MKQIKFLLALMGIAAIAASCAARAQPTVIESTNGTTTVSTNTSTPSEDFLGLGATASALGQAIQTSGLLNATNYAVAPYLTYAPSAKDHFGAGLLVPFDFPALSGTNGAIGMALGADWLGSWSLVSGNVTLKAETHPLNIGVLSFLPASVRSIGAEPIAIAGIGAAMSGNSGAATIWDLGYNVKLGPWLDSMAGGNHAWLDGLGCGFTWGEWMNAGAESGHRYHFFLSWRHNF